MGSALLNLLAVLVGALASSLPQEFFRDREETRQKNKAALEYERKKYEQLLPLLAKFSYRSMLSDMGTTHQDLIDMISLRYSFDPYPEFSEDMDEFTKLVLVSSLNAQKLEGSPVGGNISDRLKVEELASKIAAKSKKGVYPVTPVKGLSAAPLDRLANLSQPIRDYIMGRSQKK